MPSSSWSPRRERQYEHIKDSYEDRGVPEDEAEERAARTVNKERREAGETQGRPDRSVHRAAGPRSSQRASSQRASSQRASSRRREGR